MLVLCVCMRVWLHALINWHDVVLVHNYSNQQLRAWASSSSWGGSPTSFFNSKYLLLLGYKIKVILKEVWVNVSTQQSFGMFKSWLFALQHWQKLHQPEESELHCLSCVRFLYGQMMSMWLAMVSKCSSGMMEMVLTAQEQLRMWGLLDQLTFQIW